ncbi:MAG: hypothetical protein ACTFAL_11745 [Candidatus Electronema sp. V4]|uniref:hypothetical protein n=1 Tax=Candidatus Electronema sp. V4 TaxID=3454756 RepID=UPI0040554B89
MSIEERLAALEAIVSQQAVLITKLQTYLSIDSENNEIYLTGANLHIRSGSGKTDGAVNGLGNLIVGYNENTSDKPKIRTGSHNLVIGPLHSYPSYGGFVAGCNNSISREYSSVSGGHENRACGLFSSVSGGHGNTASGLCSNVSGGQNQQVDTNYSYTPYP